MRFAETMFSHGDHPKTVNRPRFPLRTFYLVRMSPRYESIFSTDDSGIGHLAE